jgi:hypothetical protein
MGEVGRGQGWLVYEGAHTSVQCPYPQLSEEHVSLHSVRGPRHHHEPAHSHASSGKTVRVFLSGDYEFLCRMYGISGAAG